MGFVICVRVFWRARRTPKGGWQRFLAYAGLPPQEALALRWSDIGKKTILFDKALSFGKEVQTKTRRARTVELMTPLAADLAEWRLTSGRPADSELVFPTRDGRPWADHDFRNWRRRRYATVAEAVGVSNRPYDLRHSLASLLLAEQRNLAEIAAQMGHTMQTLLSTYVHIIDDLRGSHRINADSEIRAAKGEAARKPVAQKLAKVSVASVSRES